MVIFPDYEFNSPGSIALNQKLDAAAGELGQNASLETGVAGGAAQLNDYSQIIRDRIPLIIAVITLVTFLVLVVILRAVLLAAIAVGLNLLSVSVAFGVLTLLFHVPADWPLGGHQYVEGVGACMIFALVFGLSIDYAVFLLSRMRERYEAGDDNATAVRFGLEKTARVITGAAAIMLAVFVVFAGRVDRDGEPTRDRAHRRGRARRHRGADRPAAGADAAAGRPRLVAAAPARSGCCRGSTSSPRQHLSSRCGYFFFGSAFGVQAWVWVASIVVPSL